MITVQISKFRYRDEVVLQDISHTFSGQVHGIVGMNGAGKTTFFNILAGYLRGEGCSVFKDGAPVKKREVAFIDTDLYFYPKLTAREFLSVFKASSEVYNEERLSDLFRLPLDNLIEEYSTGMKKKLLLLSQIKQDKQIYILDEPFNGLDLETNKILETIIELLSSRGKTVFISSHILEPLLNICSDIQLIKNKTFYKNFSRDQFPQIQEELFGEYTREVKKELLSMM